MLNVLVVLPHVLVVECSRRGSSVTSVVRVTSLIILNVNNVLPRVRHVITITPVVNAHYQPNNKSQSVNAPLNSSTIRIYSNVFPHVIRRVVEWC